MEFGVGDKVIGMKVGAHTLNRNTVGKATL